MKIAMIVPYPIFPPDEGGRVRAYNLLKHISREHQTLLFTPKSSGNSGWDLPTPVYETTAVGRPKQMFDLGFMRRALRIARKERPGVIVAEYPWPGLHAAYLARRLGVPFVLDAPNVEGDRFRSTGSRAWPAVALYERLITHLAKTIFVVSPEDRERFVRKGISRAKIQVVPNGVDPDVLFPDPEAGAAVRRELGIEDERRLVLFFGQLSYAPNREAVRIIEREIMPRLERSGERFMFIIAGKNDNGSTSATSVSSARFVGAIPSIAAYINAADVVAVPVMSGGGTRLKVLEGVACGTPVVSTTVGAEGIDRTACDSLLTVRDSWDAFADAIAERGVKAGNVPDTFLDMYSWRSIVSRIEWPR